METIHLYIMNIGVSGITSGVDRHLEKLLEGLKSYPSIRVCRIQLLNDRNLIMRREEQKETYTLITLPLPQNYKEIVAEKYWMRQYNEQIFRIIRNQFPNTGRIILHLHTLNLIDLALLIKRHIPCKIITHLHCIPWKNLYNSKEELFNALYALTLSGDRKKQASALFATNDCELDAYRLSDHIISVTECATNFLTNIMKIPHQKITRIHNGMNDYAGTYRKHDFTDASSPIRCLFVANASKSKGVDFVFKALRSVAKRGYNVELNIAGYITPTLSVATRAEHKDLAINILGALSFDQLTDYYRNCDIGVIASVQEQWSMAAVEMAMFGLPVVTTAVDGLDELFTDNVDALKVDTRFTTASGLSVDTDEMAKNIIRLIEDRDLRMKLSNNVRRMYEEELSLEYMMQQIIHVYQKTIGGLVV